MDNTKTNAKNGLKWIYAHCKFIIPSLTFLVIVGALSALCSVAFALVSKRVVDAATDASLRHLFFGRTMELVGMIAIELVLWVAYSTMSVRVSGRLEIGLKERLFKSILGKDYRSASAYHSGELMTRIRSDVNVVTSAVMNIIPNFVMLVTRVVSAAIALFAIDSTFAMILVVVSPMLLVVSRLYSKKMKMFHKKCQEAEGRTHSFMLESIQNLLVIKAFGSEDDSVARSHELQNENLKLKVKRNFISIMANISVMILFTGGYYAALAWGAYRLGADNPITVGTFTAMLQLVGQVQTPFKGMGSLIVHYHNAIASAERIAEIENLPCDEYIGTVDNPDAVYDDMEEICFEHITFAYDDDEIFKDASLRLKKGEFAVIGGVSGIGKSTLVRMLLGLLRPQEGEVYIKGASASVPISAATRALFGYVPQGNMILSGTIRDNVRFAEQEADDEEIWNALAVAQMKDMVEALPDALDTVLGEKGLGLSEGQIQRLAVARALLRKSPILLLDEATSALDEQTEKNLLCALRALRTKTCIIISHKRAAADVCDILIRIENRKIYSEEAGG
ncbi:MAG: ABC transporter ATP-binding protein [Clostridia bacterium]|nr:ABC transporter ATP-binding protein [Clostridia bacterium]